eukprot:279117-Pyramimonas_sp.AAC.1
MRIHLRSLRLIGPSLEYAHASSARLVCTQAYFAYDAHKSGGVTVSHLRFGPRPIAAPYEVQAGAAHYVAVHHEAYVGKYNVLLHLKREGVFVLNTAASDAEGLEALLPARVRQQLAYKKASCWGKMHATRTTIRQSLDCPCCISNYLALLIRQTSSATNARNFALVPLEVTGEELMACEHRYG